VLPPIPAPPPIQTIAKGSRPLALKFFIGISLLSLVVWQLLPEKEDPEISGFLYWLLWGLVIVLHAGWLTILWFLWQGHNWARIVTMIGCALTMTFIAFINQFEGPYANFGKALNIFDTLFSLFWLIWLRGSAMKAFTKGKPA
jgi:hypothetical protein